MTEIIEDLMIRVVRLETCCKELRAEIKKVSGSVPTTKQISRDLAKGIRL